jgi:hypothetical protein
MSNLNIRLNMAALQHTVQKMKGKSGEIEVLVIPIEANHLFKGEKGLYLDATAFELKEPKERNGKTDTHLVKISLPKEVYSKMTQEEKNAQPIFGNVSSWGEGGSSNEAATQTSAAGSDLPW